ncbi:MAG TPA: TetR/AcrR family transcriptional regulator [Solirubrobacterales bacterium]
MSPPGEVIWNRPERAGRGPAPSLTRDQIAAAAVRLADAEGIDAVSMRRLATALGVAASSLYRYVERKDDLLELMADAVMGEVEPAPPGSDWRLAIRTFATEMREMIQRHPWAAAVGAGRPSLGPNSLDRAERLFAAIDATGLDIDQLLLLSDTVGAFVRGSAIEALGDEEAWRRSGRSREQWMEAHRDYIGAVVESGRYPLLTRIVLDASSPHDPDRIRTSFELGLERVLDGFAAEIEKR